jgi:hypothetical protein
MHTQAHLMDMYRRRYGSLEICREKAAGATAESASAWLRTVRVNEIVMGMILAADKLQIDQSLGGPD